MNGKRHAVVVNGAGQFLGRGGKWVNEYPDALHLLPRQAIRMLISTGPGTIAIAFYGDDRQANLARNPGKVGGE